MGCGMRIVVESMKKKPERKKEDEKANNKLNGMNRRATFHFPRTRLLCCSPNPN